MEIKIALAGNPNCGKTTLFNELTGSNQYVGNWAGVTVEKKEGYLKGDKEVIIQDLPGIYSLSPYTLEEVVARNYIVKEKPDVILNVVDGTNIERNLYLTTQLIETGVPVVIAINMMDAVRKNGDDIDIEKLGKSFKCEIIQISALKNEGTLEAAQLAVKVAKEKKKIKLPHVYGGCVEHAIAHIEESIEDLVEEDLLRWYAIKCFERDEKAYENINVPDDVKEHIEEHIKECENEMDDDADSIIINQRYEYVTSLVEKAVTRGRKPGELTVSDKIDRIVTNRWLALPIFAGLMFLVYYIAVTTVGTFMTDWINDTLFGSWIEPGMEKLLTKMGASHWLISLVVNGIVHGIGTPLGFVPQLAIVFIFLSFLEDCGYMARIAFIMDKLFRKFGLSGKSFIPFLISSGCGVPGILATRTIESEKDRRMTMMTTTMIPCSAKLPVIALISGYLMGGAWWMAPAMYFLGVGLVIVYCLILKKTKEFAGESIPFVMELPNYHMPVFKSMFMHVWERVWAFIKKAGTVLFLCCTIMWFLGNFGLTENGFGLTTADRSLLAIIGTGIAPLFIPLGFGTWQSVASSLSGFVAKESIVSTMSLLSAMGVDLSTVANTEGFHAAFNTFFPTKMAALSFLIFNLFNSPCIAAVTTLAKEIGRRRWFVYAILFQNISAYIVALLVYQLGGLMIGQVAFTWATVLAIAVLVLVLYLLFRKDKNKKLA